MFKVFELDNLSCPIYFMRNEEVLYIGLNGYAGSGKDTVAKALTLLLSQKWDSLEQFKEVWEKEAFTSAYATYMFNKTGSNVMCIAFADQLKQICSAMFGIPIENFYYNKENSWIDIKNGFKFTQVQPYADTIITADEYYDEVNSNVQNPDKRYMSLREALVYVGTYVCQMYVNKNTFVNSVENSINNAIQKNSDLKYVICTDVRFCHELDYIKKHHGVNITIKRDGVEQLKNIAEHDLDDNDDYDFTIYNNSTYDDLLWKLWEVANDIIFKNKTVQIGNEIIIREYDEGIYQTCIDKKIDNIIHSDSGISQIKVGQDALYVGQTILGKTIVKIEMDDNSNDFFIRVI